MKWISPDDDAPEPYVLTKEEEEEAFSNAVIRERSLYMFNHLRLGEKVLDIEQKLSQFNWDEVIDKQELFALCNSNKNSQIWQEEQRKKEIEAHQEKLKVMREKHTAKFIFNLMSWTSQEVYGKKLIVNNFNKHLISTICFFISKDIRFETELGFSFKKGLLIRGISGLGKTHLVNCVKNNEFNPVIVLSMLHITDEIKSEGEYFLPAVLPMIYYLDDVGTEEPTVNHYGTKISFFKNFIESFYLNNHNNFDKLIISTNNNFNELEGKYGFRVRSRIKDMFNIVDVTGKDMRGV